MASIVYALCAVTSLLCALLLGRSYARNRSPLLFWSCACFAMFAVSNSLLFLDLAVVPHVDLSVARSMTNLLGFALLLYGLAWESK
jgi:hypothetical protein